MDTQAILNAINEIKLSGGQVIAYSAEDFNDLYQEQPQEQFDGDTEEMVLYDDDGLAETKEKLVKYDSAKAPIIIYLFNNDDASSIYALFSELTREMVQDYTSPNDHAQRLRLLHLAEAYRNL